MFHNKKSTLMLAAAISAGFQTTAMAAEDVPVVVVSAARAQQSTMTIPGNIKIITREDIEASGAQNFADIIRSVGGVHITDLFGDGTQSTVAMRGFSSNTAAHNTLVIVDGRRLNNIDLSGPDLNQISIKDIEQIEIVQSSAGVLYGDQAVGGVINVITRKPDTLSVDAQVQTGSYDRTRFIGRVSDRLSNDVSYVVSTDFLRSDNYRDNNSIDNMNLLARVDYDFSDGNVYAEVQRIDKDQETPGALFENEVEVNRRQSTANFVDDYISEIIDIARLGTRFQLSEQWSVEAEVSSRQLDSSSLQSGAFYKATTPFVIESKQIEFTPRLVGAVPFNDSQILLTAGVDYLEADYTSYLEDKYKARSIYLQGVVPVVKDTEITLGARKGRIENEMSSFFTNGELTDRVSAYEVGVHSQLTEKLSVFARYDENFRFAKVDELSYTTPGENLRTQTGESKELGAAWREQNYGVKVQLYRLELVDEIAYDPTAIGPSSPIFDGANVNLDPTTHDGMILETDYVVSKQLDLAAAFSYSDATFDSGPYEGNKISGVPERQLSLSGNYRVTSQLRSFLEMLYTDDHYISGDNANQNPKLDGYTVVNASLGYRWDEFELSLRVNNLLDKKYSESANESYGLVSYFPSPERNIWLTAAVRF